MATFSIHEDVCNYIPTNKIIPKVIQTQNILKDTKFPAKRLPLRSNNNVIYNGNNVQIKKETVTYHQPAIKKITVPPKIIASIHKENRCSKELFEELHFKDSGIASLDGFENIQDKFYFPRDQLYLTTIEYHDNIYIYLRNLERNLKRPKFDYMSRQSELTPKMRSILVDWLASVSEEYNMQPQTLHLAVQYIDCFLSRMSVIKTKFQLVGTAAMMIAAKYEEIYPPGTKEWAYLTAESITTKQLLKMEQLILKMLQFDVARPTSYSFINHLCFVCDLPKKLMMLAMFFSELVLLEGEDYLKYLPSQVASASVALARHTLNETELWPKKLELQTGYTLKQLSPIIKRQNKTFKDSPTKPQQAIQEKYRNVKYGRVSLFQPKDFDSQDMEE